MGKRLWLDPQLRAELDYCVPKALPHKTFLGWDPDDQAKALAYDREMSTVCPSCGTRESDWIDPETHRPFVPPRIEPVTHVCHGCETTNAFRRAVDAEHEPGDSAFSHGITVRLAPFDPDRGKRERDEAREAARSRAREKAARRPGNV